MAPQGGESTMSTQILFSPVRMAAWVSHRTSISQVLVDVGKLNGNLTVLERHIHPPGIDFLVLDFLILKNSIVEE